MLAEMEFTGQAFEEMQEQNVRLLQQLREKDDANLKLMSEVRKFHFKYVINDNLGGDCTLPPPPSFSCEIIGYLGEICTSTSVSTMGCVIGTCF